MDFFGGGGALRLRGVPAVSAAVWGLELRVGLGLFGALTSPYPLTVYLWGPMVTGVDLGAHWGCFGVGSVELLASSCPLDPISTPNLSVWGRGRPTAAAVPG